ncbi:MAG: endonuclease domain-containing protein [Ktedonobacterales bacterium]
MRYWQETTSQEARTNETLRRLRLDRHERKLAAKRRSRIQHVYGITPEQYDKILEAQNYLCALCGCELTSEVVPSVDHCHKINEMRGIICRKCNLMLGLAEDNPKTLIMGARYLQQFS